MKNFKLIDVVLILILVLVNLYIGTPLKYNIDIVIIFINIVVIIYNIFFKIKNKKNVELNFADILVVIIACSSIIPLISGKYLRLRDTIYSIVKYFSMLNLYLIIKKYVKKDKKNIKLLTNVLIVMSIILIIFGIDLLTLNFFEKIYDFFLISKLYNESTYNMMSLFKYSNALAIFLCFISFLTLGLYLNEKNESKIQKIYGMIIFFQIFGILASYSRSCFLLHIVFSIVFLCCAREKRRNVFKIIFVSYVSAGILFLLFSYFRISGNIIGIILSLVFVVILNYIFLFKLKLKNKKMLLIIGVLFFTGLAILLLQSHKNLILFNNKYSKKSFRKQNIKVEENTEYCIKIDLNSISDIKDNFEICIKEFDDMEKKIAEKSIEFDNYEGVKEINLITQSNTKMISIVFKCYNITEFTKFEVRNLSINEENIKINYGWIPLELINKIQKININAKSFQARILYYKESLKIASSNFLFGYGGNAWRFLPKESNIEGSIAEHSYPMQLLIQFGIVGLLSYILLLFIILKKIYIWKKAKNNDYFILGIICSVFILVIHSIIDFEMSFFNILIMFYMYISVLSSMLFEDKFKINYKCLYIYIVFLILFLYINSGSFVAYNIHIDNIQSESMKLNTINFQIALAPYDYSYRKDKVNLLTTLKNSEFCKKNDEIYNIICNDIVKQQKFILNIEKKKDEEEYKTLLYNLIDLITEENQDEILNEIIQILNEDMPNKIDVINRVKNILIKKLNNKKTNEFILKLNKMESVKLK